ncbi:copper resistance protein B, partial [Xanthomonas euvesicatoria]
MPMEQGAQTQTQDHSAHQAPTSKPAPAQKPATPAKTSEATIDHAAMGHAAPQAKAAEPAMQGMDHSQMGHVSPASTPAAPTAQAQSMQGMDHSQMGHGPAAPTQPRTPIPAVTDADRKAAIAPEHAHPVHDNSIKSYVLLNRLEAWDADPGTGLGWEGQAWIGTDLNRVWLRSEGERTDGQTESADLEVLYGRSISTWWDVVAGVRHDFKPGASQNFAAIGVQGLAPMKFEVSATAYLGEGGQTAANVEAEYELLLT